MMCTDEVGGYGSVGRLVHNVQGEKGDLVYVRDGRSAEGLVANQICGQYLGLFRRQCL